MIVYFHDHFTVKVSRFDKNNFIFFFLPHKRPQTEAFFPLQKFLYFFRLNKVKQDAFISSLLPLIMVIIVYFLVMDKKYTLQREKERERKKDKER